jgi:adenine/guanine phosphoribosyltransferase-like PRPP-binding protein
MFLIVVQMSRVLLRYMDTILSIGRRVLLVDDVLTTGSTA